MGNLLLRDSLGLKEKQSGIVCLGAQSVCSGRKKCEDIQPLAAQSLREIAEKYVRIQVLNEGIREGREELPAIAIKDCSKKFMTERP